MRNLIIFLLVIGTSSASAKASPLKTVEHVELNRYAGKWYEIARFDQKFQKNCTAVSAEYTLKKNGEVKVQNICRLFSPDGKLKSSIARAWVTDKNTNAKLKVQFFLKRFRLPFLAGNYWILDLDQDYKHAIVGDPSRKYLWILSRTKDMDESLYNELVARARSMDFDVTKLQKTIH